ncbi:segregation and condensation protein A [Dethiosulfatarculus sandiegensis]|uniref:Segregation and condensation protein A n=1 Tax=Dethiosulfatarculus sandiegensis TaxID=1429043 RepID=A0A0D2HNH4_9BACT|nr:segregation/condensation protein A [Dethiosulfatarculus sandiegensis]KIX12113.1 chromosome segregation and condensation protein ScpA [Dethiosulfatarculus sandiegensis]
MGVSVKLEIFEGPLDLLLHLIRKNEVDIYDIPIALITRQYLEYLELMREMNISLAGDFLVMAATLTHIKSKSILPSHDPSDDEDEEEGSMEDLVAQLKEHMRLKAAAQELDSRPRLQRDIFPRGGGQKELDQALAQGKEPPLVRAGLFDLIEAFHRLMQRQVRALDLSLPDEGISLEDRMTQLLEMIKSVESILFEELFADVRTRDNLVVTFLALLELTRLGLMKVYQQRTYDGDSQQESWGVLRIFNRPLQEDEEA